MIRTDHYRRFDHPVLELAGEPPTDLFAEMDQIADELRRDPRHVPDDDKIAFRQLQRRRVDLTVEQFRDLFEVWHLHYRARDEMKAGAQ